MKLVFSTEFTKPGLLQARRCFYDCFYVVEQGQQAVEMRFGAYKTVKEAGLRWHMPYPIESVEVVNIQQIRTVEVGYRTSARSNQATTVGREALMLTADENIIDIHLCIWMNT